MIKKMGDMFDHVLDYYIVSCLFIVLFILSLIGVGDVRTISALGVLLCVVGLPDQGLKSVLTDSPCFICFPETPY